MAETRGTVVISFSLNHTLYEELMEYHKATGLSKSKIANLALMGFFNGEPGKRMLAAVYGLTQGGEDDEED